MARFLIEHSFPEALDPECDVDQHERIRHLVESTTDAGMVWLRSYIAIDRRRAVTIAEAVSAAAIRAVMLGLGWPIDRITEIRVLDPQALL